MQQKLSSGSEFKLSVIVPVCNVADYIEDYLRSLLDQGLTEDEYEILCIDNGSTERYADVNNRFTQNHHQVRLISQQNKGVSPARNTDIEAERGKLIVLADADDMVTRNVYSMLIAEMEATGAYSWQFNYDEVDASVNNRSVLAMRSKLHYERKPRTTRQLFLHNAS